MSIGQAVYSDVVENGAGVPIAGASVALYPVSAFGLGVLPSGVPGFGATATATTSATGSFTLRGLPPDDYHVLVQYTPPGGVLTTLWKYNVAVGTQQLSLRGYKHDLAAGIPRTLAKLAAAAVAGGLIPAPPVTIVCIGDGTTVGYQATGVVSGGWVAQLCTLLAGLYPSVAVTRYDPTSYAVTLDAAIPGWSAAAVQGGAAGAGQLAVVNAGVTGDTVLRALRRSANFSAASWYPAPDLYIVLLGYGEAGAVDPTAITTAADLEAHVTGLVNVLRTQMGGSAEVVLCTLPYGNPSSSATGDTYSGAIRGAAALSGCAVVDLRQLWNDHYDPTQPNNGYGSWLDSGLVYPSGAGHGAIAGEIAKLFDPASAAPVGGPLTAGVTPEVVRVLNTSAEIATGGGGWSTVAGNTFQLGTLLASGQELRNSTAGATLTFSGRFSEVWLLGRRWHDSGQISVTIDGVGWGTYDLYRANPASVIDLADSNGAVVPQDRMFLAGGLPDAVHTLVLTVLASKNPASTGYLLRFDALELVRLKHGGQQVEGTDVLQKLAGGSATAALAASSTGSVAVSYTGTFVGAPVVVASATDPNYYAVVGAITNVGCTVTVVRRDGTNVTGSVGVEWMALGH